ncbi:unnamed protein product [marine sediment metagenome]|uniref:Uncharacterized protein n=1 Tax=marine sediment metagenome TaxID=412755 RepID=X0TYG7_9ZZZZ
MISTTITWKEGDSFKVFLDGELLYVKTFKISKWVEEEKDNVFIQHTEIKIKTK